MHDAPVCAKCIDDKNSSHSDFVNFLQWDANRGGQYSGGGQAAAMQGGNINTGGYSATSATQGALTGQFTDAQLAQYAASGQMGYQGGGQQGVYGTGASQQVLKVAADNSNYLV